MSKKRIKSSCLEAGDIVLTASRTKLGKGIRLSTNGLVSHAMICVQHGSIIDSTAIGVHARNLQRELFDLDEEVFAFRLRTPLTGMQLAKVIDFARSEIGTRYSKAEAVRSVLGGPKPRNKQQFCSRLVARAYAGIGLNLVGDKDYCTPEDLRTSPLLYELSDVTEVVPDAELAAWRERPDPIRAMQESQNHILNVARQLDGSVEHFGDLDRLVQHHPEWDGKIAQAYRDSGYLDIWSIDFNVNPWHYNVDDMNAITNNATIEHVRSYCIETIREAYSGGSRFVRNLHHYRASFQATRRETTELLISLYETLVSNDRLRRQSAAAWLNQHFPDDIDRNLERVEPHSELWFSIVDYFEPNLGALARMSMLGEGSAHVCSSCGDAPAGDCRLVNSAEAMPGVPSLRLCDDCIGIRRSRGEVLELYN